MVRKVSALLLMALFFVLPTMAQDEPVDTNVALGDDWMKGLSDIGRDGQWRIMDCPSFGNCGTVDLVQPPACGAFVATMQYIGMEDMNPLYACWSEQEIIDMNASPSVIPARVLNWLNQGAVHFIDSQYQTPTGVYSLGCSYSLSFIYFHPTDVSLGMTYSYLKDTDGTWFLVGSLSSADGSVWQGSAPAYCMIDGEVTSEFQ